MAARTARSWVEGLPPFPAFLRQLGALAPAAALVMAYVLVYVADTWREPLYTTPIFFGLMVVSAWRPLDRSLQQGIERLEVRCAGLVALCLIPILVNPETVYQGMRLYHNPGAMGGALVLAAVAASILVVRPPRPLIALGLLVIAGVAIRSYAIGSWSINPGVRDMLPLVISANKAFLSGDHPYAIYTMQAGSQIPLTYPPLMWLAHLPAVAWEADVRWTFVVCDVVLALGLGIPAILRSGRRGGLVLIGIATYIFIPVVHWNGMYAEPQIDWAILGVLLGAIISRRPLWIGVAMGLGLITRPFNVVITPMIVVWLVVAFGSRRAFQATLIAGVIAALGYLPFVLTSPTMFYLGTVDWLLQYGPAHADWFHTMMGFSGPLYEAHHADWQRRAQLIIVGLGLLWTVLRVRTTRHFLMTVLFVYAGFVAFNSLLWMSFWISVCIVATAVLATGDDDPTALLHRRSSWTAGPRWRLAVELLVALLVLSAGGLLALELRSYFSTDGRDDAAEALEEQLKPGDLVVDLSGPRLAFMETPPLVASNRHPTHEQLGASPYMTLRWPPMEGQPWYAQPRGAPLRPGHAARIWVVDRYGWWEQFPLLSSEDFYKEGERQQFGRYTLILFKRKPAAQLATAARHAGQFEARLEAADGTVTPGRWDAARQATVFEDAPAWSAVEVKRCRISGTRTMIWAHPVDGHTTAIRFTSPAGASYALLSAGFDDPAVVWGHGPARVALASDTGELAAVDLPNKPGLRSVAARIDPAVPLEVHISAPESGLRHLCFDVSWWK